MDIDKQKLLLELLLSSPNLFAMCNSIIKPEFFDVTIRKTVNFSQTYFEKYKSIPKPEQVRAETGMVVTNYEMSPAEMRYAADEVEVFCRNKAIEAAILAAPGLLEKQDFGKIEATLKDAISVGLTKDLGVDYFANPEQRLRDLLDSTVLISSGWRDVDEVIGGGLAREELLLFMANSGVGKSVFMLNLARNLLKQKLNVLYISLELGEKVVSKRLDSMLSGISQKDILSNIDRVSAAVVNASANYGKLFVKRMPESTTNANHIRTYLKEFEQTHGFLPDAIVIDYLDLMTTNHKIPLDNLFVKDKYVAEEVRAMGWEFNALMISASQMGRAALEADEINQGHIQGGISKVNTADNLAAIIQTEQMRAAGEYMLEFAKCRNSDGVGKRVMLSWDPISLIVGNIDDNDLKFKKKDKNPQNKPSMPGSSIGKTGMGQPQSAASLLSAMQNANKS